MRYKYKVYNVIITSLPIVIWGQGRVAKRSPGRVGCATAWCAFNSSICMLRKQLTVSGGSGCYRTIGSNTLLRALEFS